MFDSNFLINYTVCPSMNSLLGHYVIDCLESISVLHVLLMIYFRLWKIKNPMTRTGSLKFRKTLVIITWIVPIVSKLPYLFLWKYHYEFIIYMNIQHHILSTLSVLLIITLYFGMMFTIKNEKSKNKKILSTTQSLKERGNNRKATLLISRLVLVIVLCYVPYVIHRSKDIFGEVNFFATSGSTCWKFLFTFSNGSVEVMLCKSHIITFPGDNKVQFDFFSLLFLYFSL